MKNIDKYFEDYNKEENWTNTDFNEIDQKTFLKAILVAFGVSVVLLIFITFGLYELIQFIK